MLLRHAAHLRRWRSTGGHNRLRGRNGSNYSNFGTLNLNTGVFSHHVQFEDALAGLAVINNRLYAGSYSYQLSHGTLYTINPANGSLTVVGTSSVDYQDFGSTTGGLYAVNVQCPAGTCTYVECPPADCSGRPTATLNLYSINSATGAATLIGPTGLPLSLNHSLSNNSSTLYYAAAGNLYTLNPGNGAATLVGNAGPNITTGDLVVLGGILYATFYDSSAHTTGIATINTASGASTPFPSAPLCCLFIGFAPLLAGSGGVVPGDFDGDGRPDIALQFPDGSMGVWYLGGTGRQLPITSFAFLAGPSSGISLVDTEDLNRDGVMDLVLRFNDGSIGVWYMGGPQGRSITSFAFISGPIVGWMPVGMADLNGDGYLDLIIQYTDGTVGVWYLGGTLGNQIQGFAPISGPIAGWKLVGMADLNNDGHPDAIIQNTDGTIGVWYLTGAQGNQIQGFAVIAGASTWLVMGVVDMDGDGHPDLTIRNTDGTVGVWFLGGAQGNQITGFTPITTPGATSWKELTAH